MSYVDQCRTLTALRAVRPEVLTCGVVVCRGTLKRLDWAFAGFYRRCRAGQRPGFPRFRSRTRWDSLQWEDRSGWRLDPASRRLYLMGIGGLKVRLHRPIRGTPKAITLHREGRRWWVTIRCVDVPAEPLPATGRPRPGPRRRRGVCTAYKSSATPMLTCANARGPVRARSPRVGHNGGEQFPDLSTVTRVSRTSCDARSRLELNPPIEGHSAGDSAFPRFGTLAPRDGRIRGSAPRARALA